MYCINCGNKNKDSAKFCFSCGQQLNDSANSKDNTEYKSAEIRAEEIKSNVSKKSKESAFTLFYILKPILKLKLIIPTTSIILISIFWNDGVEFYKGYQYESRINAEKKAVNKWVAAHQRKGTFADYDSKLLWQDTSNSKNPVYSADYFNYCKNLDLANIDSWRLPTLTELRGLYSKKNSLVNLVESFYWGGTHMVDFTSGYENDFEKDELFKSDFAYMRCVTETY